MQCLPIRQTTQMIEEAVHMLLNGWILPVGTDYVLALSPQGIHWIQLRRPIRQPQQRHPLRLAQGGLRRMAGILIEQQGYMPSPVARLNLAEEGLKVAASPPLPRHEQPAPRPQVHGPEDYAPGIAAAQPDPGILAASRPGGPQRREQQEIGLVLGQHDAAPREGPDFPADAAFFSRAPGPG